MRHIAFLFTVLMLGTSLAQAASIEGYWYGTGYQPIVRKKIEWLTIRRSDGTFSVEFRDYENCQLKFVQHETGQWTASDKAYATKTLTINGRALSVYFNDTYKILDLDDRHMRYVHDESGQEWAAERVTPDFIFPECKNVS